MPSMRGTFHDNLSASLLYIFLFNQPAEWTVKRNNERQQSSREGGKVPRAT